MRENTKFLLAVATILSATTSGFAITKGATFGIVDFSTCIMESKYGKKEQAGFESLKNQIQSMIEDHEKQIAEVTGKLQDQDYLDSLSPEAEIELKGRYQALMEEQARYQNQYYQALNQANMRVMQTMSNHITQASQEIAKDMKIPLVVSKEAAFYYDPNFDMTQLVVEKLNKDFDIQAKKESSK